MCSWAQSVSRRETARGHSSLLFSPIFLPRAKYRGGKCISFSPKAKLSVFSKQEVTSGRSRRSFRGRGDDDFCTASIMSQQPDDVMRNSAKTFGHCQANGTRSCSRERERERDANARSDPYTQIFSSVNVKQLCPIGLLTPLLLMLRAHAMYYCFSRSHEKSLLFYAQAANAWSADVSSPSRTRSCTISDKNTTLYLSPFQPGSQDLHCRAHFPIQSRRRRALKSYYCSCRCLQVVRVSAVGRK